MARAPDGREVVQPIKQAFREIYVLTPAEEVTERYSNRFAGHIFRQVQARALFRRRSWRSTALAWWDDGHDVGVASKPLAGSGLVAEFVYDPIEDVTSDGDLYPCARAIRCGSETPPATNSFRCSR